jgi:hypothetical protein
MRDRGGVVANHEDGGWRIEAARRHILEPSLRQGKMKIIKKSQVEKNPSRKGRIQGGK